MSSFPGNWPPGCPPADAGPAAGLVYHREAMAALPPPGADDALYLVDIAGWIHRSFHALPPIAAPTGEPVNAVSGVAGMLVRLLVDRRPGYLGVAVDSPGPGFRHAIFPAYKAARPPRDPELTPQIDRVRQIVAAHRIPILEAPGFEADDVIAAAARRALAAGLRVVIVAHDKDLCQLVGDRVVVWDGRDRVIGPEEVRARWGVGPELLGDLLALAGDASDGIPGIPGVGAKTAADLLSRRGSLAEVLLKADWEASRTLRAKLHRHAEEARMSRRLVALRADAPIRFDPSELRVGWGDPAAIREVYEVLGFTRLAGEVVRLDKAPADPAVVAAAEAEAEAEAEAGAEAVAEAGAEAEAEAVAEAGAEAEAAAETVAEAGAEAEDWRALVRWPDEAEQELRATPVGRWDLLVGRWALLAPAPGATAPVLARVIANVDVRPAAERELESRPRARVEIVTGGVSRGEHEIPNGMVMGYPAATEGAPVRADPEPTPADAPASVAAPAAPASAAETWQMSLFD